MTVETPRTGLPRHGLLREITDRAVLDQVLEKGQVTRAELAAATGISKPTISESVRRLTDSGALAAAGSRTGLRGRVATVYELATGAGWVLALQLDQAGIGFRATDLAGSPFFEGRQPPVRVGDGTALATSLRTTVQSAVVAADGRGPLGAVALSVANPVDPKTSQIVDMPHSPFPEGVIQPARVLAGLVAAPVLIENDVNLEALAERLGGAAMGVDSFAYLHLGAGFGLGLYVGDRLIRGAHGMAGEIGYVSVGSDPPNGPGGDRWQRGDLAQMVAAAGFGRPDAPSNDVAAVLATFTRAKRGEPSASVAAAAFGTMIAQAIVAVCAVADPDLVLVGGPIGAPPGLLGQLRTEVAQQFPGPVRIEQAALGPGAPLVGALHLALELGRSRLLTPGA
ncbi:putative NBD/HSP70 family sugar kinase [Nakamurella sp. UYEF19]|uniref:ROK family transcriptional regulator n=1 Tax=Nakamurella sp. UYEF19 TaxID=1756392 RepID=UPI00339894BA